MLFLKPDFLRQLESEVVEKRPLLLTIKKTRLIDYCEVNLNLAPDLELGVYVPVEMVITVSTGRNGIILTSQNERLRIKSLDLLTEPQTKSLVMETNGSKVEQENGKGENNPKEDKKIIEEPAEKKLTNADKVFCPDCKTKLIFAGGCHGGSCPNPDCGYSSC